MDKSTQISGKASKPRACLSCGFLQSLNDFKTVGCPNCPFLNTNKGRNFMMTTTQSYKGQIAYLNVKKSWVAKWQRHYDCKAGYYAMIVDGELSDDFIIKLEQSGKEYINRTTSFEL
ncbi:hypothetical protein NUSPORA_01770 [Nucleospora cyclopteri]